MYHFLHINGASLIFTLDLDMNSLFLRDFNSDYTLFYTDSISAIPCSTHWLYINMDYMTAAQKWSKNISTAP